ncbi:MerR family transcriptional regulator [Streptomyces sp. NBC_00083]|uniref:MerR family transcriptional regulator n=1 Tax=Streptomyces sp. NBC_00083 TaxID=2975647 RepID=UPI002253001A|nr:MerR family transcriptional regulator [Streptomyces sp. NBC_00083]MCX5383493.1 MerR family transcriptional regulator [Streptomyces sp. NBC_00083]
MSNGVTIGQAASFVGVTVKTVRHYHKLGLVGEPERDSSGYRRYGSAELLHLVQVRTLAAAGVPLAGIGPLLDADAAGFATVLADVEAQLADRIEELTARRDTLRRLADGDRALLPDRACAILERMRGLGFAPDYVAAQREALVLAKALVPDGFDGFLAQLERGLDDPEHVELTRRGHEAEAWDPDDPRIEELADAMAARHLANPALRGDPEGQREWAKASAQYQLINSHREDQAPVAARLTALTEAKLRAAGIPMPQR